MNDRFKFRAWDKTENAYIEDAQFTYDDGCEGGMGSFRHYSFRDLLEDKNCIVEQCTGLKDKNGKLIYEGDIVIKSDVSAIGYSRTRVCKVHWHNDWLSWAITTQYGDTYELSEFEPQQYEVIGNIHENADLLEVGGK